MLCRGRGLGWEELMKKGWKGRMATLHRGAKSDAGGFNWISTPCSEKKTLSSVQLRYFFNNYLFLSFIILQNIRTEH